MVTTHKKLYLIITIFIAVFSLLLLRQIIRAENIVVKHSNESLVSVGTFILPSDSKEYIFGNPGAEITFTEFNDIGCKECKKLHDTLIQFVKNHPTQVRLVWKDAPTQSIFFEPNNFTHQAAYCAGLQNKFWDFIDQAMADKKNRSEAGLKRIAENLKLDASWWTCTNSEATKKKINEAVASAQSLGLTSPPALFINNKQINLSIKQINLDELLKKVIEKPAV
jgi:protein-disulfide isomerase